jgi:nucleoside-diphosphate-sugar epimerase
MARALIGHSGFVGGNIARQHRFDEFYNSKDIEEIADRSFDLVVCSGAPAEKWRANRDPEADRRCLDRLWGALSQASTERLVLISTIDVYALPVGVDEGDDVDLDRATPYGRHRFELERRAADRFNTLVVRLPGLFGPGLKKNAIYDLLNTNEVHKIDHRACYQFYGLGRIWSDIEVGLAHGLSTLNLATEPTSIAEVAREGFGLEFSNELDRPPARYDFRTRHDGLFGGSGGYLQSKADVLKSIHAFVSGALKRCA